MENNDMFQKEILDGLFDYPTGSTETGSPLFHGTSLPMSYETPADAITGPVTLGMGSQAILLDAECGKPPTMNPDSSFTKINPPIVGPRNNTIENGTNTTTHGPVGLSFAPASSVVRGHDPPMTYSSSAHLALSATSLMPAQSKEPNNQTTLNHCGGNVLFPGNHSEGPLPAAYQGMDMSRQAPAPAANLTANPNCINNTQMPAVPGNQQSMYYPDIKNAQPSGNAWRVQTPNVNQAVLLAPRNSTSLTTNAYPANNYSSLNSDVYSQNKSLQSSLASANAIRRLHQRPRRRNGRRVSFSQPGPPHQSDEMEAQNKKAELGTKVLADFKAEDTSDEGMASAIVKEMDDYNEWRFEKIKGILGRENTSGTHANARKNVDLKLARRKPYVWKETCTDVLKFLGPEYRRVVAENKELRAELCKRKGASNGSSANGPPPDDPSSGGPPNDFGQQGPPPRGPGSGYPNSSGGASFRRGSPSDGQPPSGGFTNAQLRRGASDNRTVYSLLENLSDEESNVDGKMKMAPVAKRGMCNARKTSKKDVGKHTNNSASPSKLKSGPKHKSRTHPDIGNPSSTTAEHSDNSLNARKPAKRGNSNHFSTPVNGLLKPKSPAASKVKVSSLSSDCHIPKLPLPVAVTDINRISPSTSKSTQVVGKNHNRRTRNRRNK